METSGTRELGTGLFVFLGFAALLFLATQTTDINEYVDNEGYSLIARFSNVAGLKVRAQVTLAGVPIGRVESIEFDNESLDAVVTLSIDPQYDRIPDDSDASILTAGLLGSKYIGIEPGGSDTFLKDQDEIQITQSAIVLEQFIGKFMYGQLQKGAQE